MLRAAVIVLWMALLPSPLRAEARIALLIGNEAYGNEIGRLANPHNDVALLEGVLKSRALAAALSAPRRPAQNVARRVGPPPDDQRDERYRSAVQAALADDPAPRMTAAQLLKSWRGWRVLHAGEDGDIRARRTAARAW